MTRALIVATQAFFTAFLLAAIGAPAWAQRTPQFVVFTSEIPATVWAGGSFHVYVAASSGLPVTLAVAGPCELTTFPGFPYSILSTRAPGTCTLIASQAGNETFEPASATATVEVTVSLSLPIEGRLPAATGDVMRATLRSTDNGPVREDTLCAIDWGDPAAPGSQLGTPRSNGYQIFCEWEHAYSTTGIHRVHAAMYDSRFGYALDWFDIHVNRLAAWAISGGGSFHSPPGTFLMIPGLSGRVTLNLELGPVDSVWFALDSPVARFDVTSFGPPPLVTETRAELRGSGQDHEGNALYFAISFLEGGSTGPDKVRLVLWNASGVVYDTQPGEVIGVLPTTPIEGSITITPLPP